MKIPQTWLGDSASLEQHLHSIRLAETASLQDYAVAHGLTGLMPGSAQLYPDDEVVEGDEETDDRDYLVERITEQVGSVGIVTVDGPLVSEESFWNLMFGETAYATVARAMEYFNDQVDITDIVLASSSSGGDASGVDAAAEVIKMVSKTTPVTAWTGTSMLSAMYWLGTSGSKIRAAPMGMLGSIGVVTTLMSKHRLLDKMGIDVKVIRSGKYKALAHPAEPITEEAIAEFERRSDKLYGFFLDQVVDARGVQLSEKDTWAEGRTHFAAEAIALGLADGPPITLTDLVNELDQSANLDESAGDTAMARQIMMRGAQARAQLAAGVPLEQVPHEEVEEEVPAEPEVAAAEPQTTEVPETVGDPPQEPSAAPASQPTELVAFLKAELAEARKELVGAQAEIVVLGTERTALSGAYEAILPLAAEFVRIRQVSLGYSPDTELEKLDAASLVAKFERLDAEFTERFKVGRTSIAAEDKPETPDRPQETATALGIFPENHG